MSIPSNCEKPSARYDANVSYLSMETQRKIREFLESPLAQKALRGLRSGAKMTLNINGEVYLITSGREGLQVVLLDSSTRSDIEFWLDREILLEVLQKAKQPGMGVGDFGVLLFQSLWAEKNRGKVKFAIHASLPSLLLRGYFSVLLAGGPVVMQFLSKHGLGSIGKIKKVLTKG